jgi:PAS domain S-box-containing protein
MVDCNTALGKSDDISPVKGAPLKIPVSGLRTQIVAWSFVPTAIILLAVALVAFYAYSRVTGDLVMQQSQELTRLSANQFTAEVREYAGTLTTFGRELSSVIDDPRALRRTLAAAGNRLVVFDAGVVVLDNYGRVLEAQPERTDILGKDWSDHSYFVDLVRGATLAYSNVLPDGPAAANAIGVAVPVMGDHGELLGAAVGLFRVGANTSGALYGSIVKMRNGLASESFLIDRVGVIFYHHDNAAIGLSASNHAAWPLVAGGVSGSFRTRNSAGADVVTSYAPVPGTPWAVIRETSWAELLAPSAGYRRFLVLLLALGFIVPALVTMWGVRRITEPIRRLTHAAHEIGEGKFVTHTGGASSAEVQALVTQFNGMSGRLSESYEKLRAQNEQFDLVMRGTNDGIWDWDVRSGRILFSDRWKAMIGYEPHEIENNFDAWVRLTHPDDVNRVQEQLQNYLQGQTRVYQTEHRLRHKDGVYRWILTRGIALRDEAGRVYRMAGSHTDISELKRAHGILRGQRHFLEQLTAGVDLAKTLTDLALSVEENWPSARVMIWLLDEQSNQLEVAAHGGLTDEYVRLLEGFQRASGASAPSSMALHSRQRVIVEDITTDSRWDHLPDVRALALDNSLRSAWSEPIISSTGQPAGAFSIYHLEPHSTSEEEAQLIQTSAHLVAVAVEARRAEEGLQEAQAQLQAAYQDLERRIQERTRALMALNTIGEVVNRSLDLHAILRDALDVCLQLVGMETGAVYVLDEDDQNLIMYAQRRLPPELASLVAVVPVDQVSVRTPAGTGPSSIAVHSVASDRVRETLVQEGLRTVISVPLTAKDKLAGTLVLSTRQERTLPADEAALLTAMGRQIGVAVENGQLYEAEQARRDEADRRRKVAEGLGEILAVLNSRQSLQETLQFIVEQACRVLGSEGAALMRLDPGDGLLRVQAHTGLDEEFAANLKFPIGVAASGRALQQRRPIAVADSWVFLEAVRGRSEMPANVSEATIERTVRQFRALLSVPILVQSEPYGALSLYYHASHEFSDEETTLAQTVADQAAIAIESERLREQAEESAAVAERNRLARELHDSVTQNLYSVTLYAEAASRLLTSGATQQAAEHMRELRDTAQEALREMRLLIFELRPVDLEEYGLVGAIQARLQAVETRGGMQAELHQEGAEYTVLMPLPVQEELYHIVQESLNNALKHSRAGRVWVTLHLDPETIELEVSDDGTGFDPVQAGETGGMGLRGIAERVQRIGGELQLDSAPGQGAHVRVRARMTNGRGAELRPGMAAA